VEPVDLADNVDSRRDHIRGAQDAPVTLVEYGDFQCPYCRRAEGVVRKLLQAFGDDLRLVWRHLPSSHLHPDAQLAAEAAEAAGAQGAFWEMHDLLLAHQDDLPSLDLVRHANDLGLDTELFREAQRRHAYVRHAKDLGLDTELFREALRRHVYAERVAADIATAMASGAPGTPTFFVNGKRHERVYDYDTLASAVRDAGARSRRPPSPQAARQSDVRTQSFRQSR
jgi:protein-disulfide isomerase